MCVDHDTATHARTCSMSKLESDMEYMKQHVVNFDSETRDIITEALSESEAYLFRPNDSLQLVNRCKEQLLQCQDETDARTFAGDE